MISCAFSASLMGIDAFIVEVEVHIEQKLPGFVTVGLPDNVVKESKERVTAAIKNSGYIFPNKKITVNLAPADIRKEGSGFDLPIAMAILHHTGQINSIPSDAIFVGELALDGRLRPVNGMLSIALRALKENYKRIICSEANAAEAALIDGMQVIPIRYLKDLCDYLNNELQLEPYQIDIDNLFDVSKNYFVDFRDVKGQFHVKRSLEVAAAGGHNLLMIGPPGSGKTMLAKRIPTILPDMTLHEALETTKIHSVAGLLPPEKALIATRPFRSPHHTISDAGLIGGGKYPRPGEVSLAHHGVLFLDELPEFKKNILDMMRQPLEDNRVTIARAAVSLSYPSNFMLVAAMNPCPCGYYTDPSKECSCTPNMIQRYLGKISGPLLDRIDIQIDVPAVPFKDLSSNMVGESSNAIRERVLKAREIQRSRFDGIAHLYCNADMQSKEIRNYCRIDDTAKKLLKNAMDKLGFSARAYDRILKVARTIADLEQTEAIKSEHIGEAIQYRSLDRNLWNI